MIDSITERLQEILGKELSWWHCGGWREREARSRLARSGSLMFESQRLEFRVRYSQWEQEERAEARQMTSGLFLGVTLRNP